MAGVGGGPPQTQVECVLRGPAMKLGGPTIKLGGPAKEVRGPAMKMGGSGNGSEGSETKGLAM